MKDQVWQTNNHKEEKKSLKVSTYKIENSISGKNKA